MPTNAALTSALQRPLSALALVLQQPLLPVSPCSHHTATFVTDPAITTLAAINPFCYATILLGVLLWGKWGLFEPQGIQALKTSAVWCNGVARGVSWDYDVMVLQEGES